MNITGGKYNSLKIKAPESTKVRPTLSKVRSGVFNTISSLMDFEDASFLDCFGGSGIMSLEAISRGFKNVITIEKNYKIAEIIKKNFLSLNLNPNLICGDVVKVINNFDNKFDVIYIDPPYESIDLYEKSLNIISEKSLLKDGGIIIVECKKNNKMPNIPENFKIVKKKIYGETAIYILN